LSPANSLPLSRAHSQAKCTVKPQSSKAISGGDVFLIMCASPYGRACATPGGLPLLLQIPHVSACCASCMAAGVAEASFLLGGVVNAVGVVLRYPTR